MEITNPFSDFGKIVTGQRFIGRKIESKAIRDRLLGKNYGNVAIMGLPRIGKSSLGWNSIYIHKEELAKQKIIVVRVNSGEIKSAKSYFQSLVYFLWNDLEETTGVAPEFERIIEIKNKILTEDLVDIEFSTYLQRFFKRFKCEGYRIIYILDEFDNVKNIFQVSDFQLLRELSTNPKTQIALLTISRKTLREIEPENGALSNFYQIFYDLHLGFFNENDAKLYWEFAKQQNIQIEEETTRDIENYSSNHPFLLDLINNELFNHLTNFSLNFSKVFAETIEILKLKILNEYSSIVKLMVEENIASPAIQLITGPVFKISQIDIEKLLKYQLIKVVEERYVAFCDYFNKYLSLVQTEIDVWPLWAETESELRSIIKIHLVEKYGEDWEEPFKKANSKKIKTIDSLFFTKEKNIKAFGDLASNDLVDYTYPLDMIDCFFHSDWGWFSKIFKKQFNDWKTVFDHLAKIRNPLAHNNPNFITEADRNRAIGYCQEIISLIQNWKSK